MTKIQERVFSGIQPTGNLHLGNYLGAIKRFVDMQNQGDFQTVYCMVDLHAITAKLLDPATLRHNTRELAAGFIASGISPEKSILINQSQVPEHAQLAWIFNCIARMGWMGRMTQWKDKSGKNAEAASLGLFAYPALMAELIIGRHARANVVTALRSISTGPLTYKLASLAAFGLNVRIGVPTSLPVRLRAASVS